MISANIVVISILWAGLSVPLLSSPDLSWYREFHFGTSLPVVAKQIHMKPSEARTIHERPAVIQELEWQAQIYAGPSLRADSVKGILFSFYNGELFRIGVTYDSGRTEGMTDEDFIGAISARYGPGARPAANITLSATHLYSDGEKTISIRSERVIARWEDAQYSFNLIQSSSLYDYGLVMYSKRLEALALAAIIEAIRLDLQEAPQRELARQKKKEDENRARQETARQMNKVPFRP
jgi:hypothetical protein